MKLKFMIDEGGFAPTRAHEYDAGIDIMSPVDHVLKPHTSVVIDTLTHIAIPNGYVGMVKSRSSMNVKKSTQCEGVIDAGYTGSIRVKLYNHGDDWHQIRRGDRIAQIVVMPVLIGDMEQVDTLEETERGDGGFGSTGR